MLGVHQAFEANFFAGREKVASTLTLVKVGNAGVQRQMGGHAAT